MLYLYLYIIYFFGYEIFTFRRHHEFFNGLPSFEVHFNPLFGICIIKTFI